MARASELKISRRKEKIVIRADKVLGSEIQNSKANKNLRKS